MKKLIFLTYNATKDELVIVNNMAAIVEREYSVINIPQQNLTTEAVQDSIILPLGSIPYRLAKQYLEDHKLDNRVIQLPTLKQLQKSRENIEYRKNTQQVLNNLREELKNERPEITQLKIKKGDIDNITVEQVIFASQKLRDTTFHHNNSGELIVIGPEEGKNEAGGVFITYQELLVIKKIQETLGATEIIINRRSNGD